MAENEEFEGELEKSGEDMHSPPSDHAQLESPENLPRNEEDPHQPEAGEHEDQEVASPEDQPRRENQGENLEAEGEQNDMRESEVKETQEPQPESSVRDIAEINQDLDELTASLREKIGSFAKAKENKSVQFDVDQAYAFNTGERKAISYSKNKYELEAHEVAGKEAAYGVKKSTPPKVEAVYNQPIINYVEQRLEPGSKRGAYQKLREEPERERYTRVQPDPLEQEMHRPVLAAKVTGKPYTYDYGRKEGVKYETPTRKY